MKLVKIVVEVPEETYLSCKRIVIKIPEYEYKDIQYIEADKENYYGEV